jgi:short chain dehydrogenase
MRIIVTGGNSGIGKATAGALAAAGHSVVIACRTIPKAEQAAAFTRDSTGMWGRWIELNALPFLAQDPHVAARTTIQAVTTDLPSGTYIAPRFLKLLRTPKVTEPGKKARDPVMARRLWELSAELTGCDWTVHPRRRRRRAREQGRALWT